jgi:hypothetical protein
MLKVIFTISIFLVICFSSFANAELNIGTDLVTHYVWRGFDVLNGGSAIMPWVNYSLGETGMNLNLWSSWALTNRDLQAIRNLDEIDLTLSYSKQISNIGLSAGLIYFAYPQMEGFPDKYSTNYEPFIGISLAENELAPSLTVYYALNEDSWDGLYALLSGGYTLETDTNPVAFGFSIGYSDQSLVTNLTEAGFSDINFSISTSISTSALTFTPKFTATYVPDKAINQNQFIYWGVLGISW